MERSGRQEGPGLDKGATCCDPSTSIPNCEGQLGVQPDVIPVGVRNKGEGCGVNVVASTYKL